MHSPHLIVYVSKIKRLSADVISPGRCVDLAPAISPCHASRIEKRTGAFSRNSSLLLRIEP